MNKEQVNNRPKRQRIADAKTGVAQPQLTSRADIDYTAIAIQAADKTPKTARVGNFYTKVSKSYDRSDKSVTYTKCVPVSKVDKSVQPANGLLAALGQATLSRLGLRKAA